MLQVAPNSHFASDWEGGSLPEDTSIAGDEISVFEDFRTQFDISGKRVLEIGGSIPAELTEEASIWWSVDPLNSDSDQHGHFRSFCARAEVLPEEIENVDLVFACNSFQHVSSLTPFYREMTRRLAAQGTIFAHFGPIWTAPDGAHFEGVMLGNGRYDFWHGARVPAWSHLALDKDAFRALAMELNGDSDGMMLADYVENSSWINRIGLAGHLALPKEAGLKLREVKGARSLGYDFRPPPPPQWCAAAFEPSALERVFAQHGISPAQAIVRDLRLIIAR